MNKYSARLGCVYARKASFASERAKRSPRKASKTSMVCASQASFASERSKGSLRKPSKAKQTAVSANELAGNQAKVKSKQVIQANNQATKKAINQPNKRASKLVLIVVGWPGMLDTYDCAEIYRSRLAGYVTYLQSNRGSQVQSTQIKQTK